jgi:phosphate transport system substrate-binding protein
MLELVQELAAKFMEINPDVTIDVQGGGSGVGIQNVIDGVSEIGNSSSALKDDQKAQGLIGVDIALDGVAVIVNPNNPLTALTAEQVTKIYKGEITNWKDVGGADHAITVVNREAASGTRDAFTKFFKMSDKDAAGKTIEFYTDKAIEQNSGGGMATTVAGDEFAIGYISVGSLVDTIKALQVDGVAASKATVLDNTYKYWRPFVMVTKGDAQGLAKAFIDFCVKDPAGIEIVGKKYIPISEKK